MPTNTSFTEQFRELTGNSPYPWQVRLYKDFFSQGFVPPACSIPTGLGKTNVLTIWLIALSNRARLPRRLVYVVNRRTVVDQTTREAERLKENASIICVDKLAISTLRGQYADNREWSADPSRPAVICGTVDMIGSRLLFSGYGVGFRAKPLHAGFLGQDALLVHDEAHLEPAFQQLVENICQEQQRCGDLFPLRLMALTATSRGATETFSLDKADLEDDAVRQRLEARKRLMLHEPIDPKKLVSRIIELALNHRDSRQSILVFVSKVEDAISVRDALKKEKFEVESLTGTMRGQERDRLIETPVFKRFFGNKESNDSTVYLVCTSAGEVGIDISADHMVCDLSTLDSMAQRLGRVHRYGDPREHVAKVDVVPSTFYDPKSRLSAAREATLGLVRRLPPTEVGAHLASPQELSKLLASLTEDERRAAFAPEPCIPRATDILYDAWALTTIREPMPGRPSVEPYLHGVAEWEPPETHVAWRTEVELITGELLIQHPPQDLLDDFPIKPHELLRDRTDRIVNALRQLIADPPKSAKERKQLCELAAERRKLPVWIVGDRGETEVGQLSDLLDDDNKKVEARLAGKTLLLPPAAGGLRDGTFDGGAEPVSSIDYDVADTHERIRILVQDTEPNASTEMMRLVRSIEFRSEDEDRPRTWDWYKFRPLEGSRTANRPVPLQVHVLDVSRILDRILADLNLPSELKNALRVAAAFHDHGKCRETFQALLGNPHYPDLVLAKSGHAGAKFRSDYRHEFGSLSDIAEQKDFESLSPEMQDLVLHMIAAHHGRARPHFSLEETFDPLLPTEHVDALAHETTRRFARLQRRYGRWGLAYLESLLRAADWAASANPFEDDAGNSESRS